MHRELSVYCHNDDHHDFDKPHYDDDDDYDNSKALNWIFFGHSIISVIKKKMW